MSKFIRPIVLLAALVLTLSAHALGKQDYYSAIKSRFDSNKSHKVHPYTDISIVNATLSGIYVVVPNTPVYDFVAGGLHHHIYNNDPNIYWTTVLLQDSYQQTFYTATVCPLALISVMGSIGNYRINLDDDLCH